MPPTLASADQLLWRILSIVDENVGAGGQFAEALIKLDVAGFVVRGVNHGAGGRINAEAEAALRMIQPSGGDFIFADSKRFPAAHFLELALCAHRGHVHRKVRHRHLRFKNLFQTVAPQKFRSITIEMKIVILRV